MRTRRREQDRAAHAAWIGRGGRWMVLLLGLCVLSGCANEENLRKSKGFYQEGIARLSSDQQQAYVSFQKAVKLNPDNKEAHYALGHIYSSQGRLKLAEESLREAIRIDGDYAEANTYLGQVLANQDRWKEAIGAYRQALSNPLYPTPDRPGGSGSCRSSEYRARGSPLRGEYDPSASPWVLPGWGNRGFSERPPLH